MKNKEYYIWSNLYEDIEAIRKDMEADEGEEVSFYKASYVNCDYLEDERMNLSGIETGQIVAIADLGLWNGRRTGYKLFDTVAECLYSDCDEVKWYCDRYDFKATMSHHDGTNYIVYREKKDNISTEQWLNFIDKIFMGTVTKADITRYSKSLVPKIKKVYGWV